MTNILAIDPGPVKSAFVLYDSETKLIHDCGILENRRLDIYPDWGATRCVIEMIGCYGMPVGKSIFETCVWIGRFAAIWDYLSWEDATFLFRRDVKLHLCNDVRAGDANVRQALIDRFPATGGGKVPQIGVKAQPGPLYGVKGDIWAALGVAVTFAETRLGKKGENDA